VTTAYAVDEDLTFKEMTSRRPKYDDSTRTTLDTDPAVEVERDCQEIQHLRAYGYTDEQVMKQLNLTGHQYTARLEALGLPAYMLPEDRHVHAVLERMIAGGRPFSALGLPMGSTIATATVEISRARDAGRIVQVGTVDSGNGPIGLWQSIITAPTTEGITE
jgi:hypothetical protein